MNIGLYVKKNRDINYECALTTVKAIIANGATPVLRPSDKESFPAGVDGVMAGYSEYRIMAAAQISKAIGKPFYATVHSLV